MSRLYVARRDNRKAFMLPMSGTEKDPTLLFPLTNHLENGELDELVRAMLEKQGIRGESKIQLTVSQAEEEYEKRIKVAEARRELHRLMDLKGEGKKLMSTGNKKWKEVYYMSPRIGGK